MELVIIQPETTASIIMWIIGGFLGLIITLVIHIGNAGSAMKKQLSNHGERIAKVEVSTQNLESAAHRIEDGQRAMGEKLDRLIERK
jgi:hypothetical protein